MELRHLRYFVAVAEEENVTRAAARLHVSQPPLTRQIHDLEQELGVALFDRVGRSIRLTEAGRNFLSGARASLKRVDEAVAAVRLAGSGGGELQVGHAPSPTVEFLPQVLREFQKALPGVRVILHDLSSPEMLSGLANGRLQAAFMVQSPGRPARGIRFVRLRSVPMVLAVPPGHPFARRRTVPLERALAQPLVTYSRREYPDHHTRIVRLAGAGARRLQFVEECDGVSSFITAIESGTGIAITLASLKATAGRRLRYVPLSPAPSPVGVGVAYPGRSRSPLTQRLVATALRVCEQRPE